MSLHNRLCELLGCRFPILQAGMGGVARASLAAAVSDAGGYGCLGMVRESPSLIVSEIARVRELTDKPFAVNLIPAATDSTLFSEELDACIRSDINAVVFFWDVSQDAISRAKAAGMTVLYQVGSVVDAQAAEAFGADAIIAQGVEAGGHVRGVVTSLVLLPQVANAVNVPVIGSGGFATGASLVAAMALGAQGIHCGTAFVATAESFAHDLHKQNIVNARSEATVHTDAFAINWPAHSPVRVLHNDMTLHLDTQPFGHDADLIAREIIANEDGRPLYLWSTDSPLQSMSGDLDRLAQFAGQVSGQISCVPSAGELVLSIVTQAEEALGILRLIEPGNA